MYSKYLSALLCIFLSIAHQATAQHNKIWTFGKNSGLDFSTSPPTYIETSTSSAEGSASICNSDGELLFYSDGNTVWNRFHNAMPNGEGILGNDLAIGVVPGSASQGVTIVPSPADPNQYYLFVLNAAESMYTEDGYLRYSIIDMTLDGGNGDVIDGSKNIIIGNRFGEKVTYARGAGCYYWVITHRHDSAAFYVYKIDETGIHDPLIQESLFTAESPGIIDYGAGNIKVSHDMSRIAMQTNFQKFIQLAHFDNSTGIISGNILIDSIPVNSSFSGLAFSPDDTKLYSRKHQYDISSYPDVDAINASKIQVIPNFPYNEFTNPRNASDGKIYFIQSSHYSIGVIHEPNLSGAACDIEYEHITIPSWAFYTEISMPGIGLGNDVYVNNNSDTLFNTPHNIIVCPDEINGYLLSVSDEYDSYRWNTGEESSSINIHEAGVYWVISDGMCRITVDTFYVSVVALDIEIIGDTFLCDGTTNHLSLSNTEAESYLWNTGSTDTFLIVESPGKYYVTAYLDGCAVTDTIDIQSVNGYGFINQNDTTICLGDVIELSAISLPLPASYLWNTGESTQKLSVSQPGQYSVKIENQCGIYSDTIHINIMNCNCHILIPNTFSPNGDNINDNFKLLIDCEQLKSFKFYVVNRFGEIIFLSENPHEGWDGTYNGIPCDLGTYYYYAEINSFNQKIIKKGDILLLR